LKNNILSCLSRQAVPAGSPAGTAAPEKSDGEKRRFSMYALKKKVGQLLVGAACLLLGGSLALATEVSQKWEVVVPTGIIEQASLDPAPRITSLEGKTIALRWNGKHNGDIVLDRLAELLKKQFPSVTIVKIYRDDPSTNRITGNVAEALRVTEVVKTAKPDLVISAQAD
jgi:hypothetical protein